jgi:Uncharacterised nucleotidyltransferase
MTHKPSLTQVATALRKTTETLGRELATPTTAAPLWSEFEWRIARAVAAMHGISSLLCTGLRWEGPESWRRFLHEQWENSVGRHLQLTYLWSAIDSQSRHEGIPVVALKGAALYASGIYAAGERPMGDIDLLIREEDATTVARLLGLCDYVPSFTNRRHQVFQPRTGKTAMGSRLGEHIDSPIKVEVHVRVAESLPFIETDITPYLFPGSADRGLNAYPSSAALMMHLLLHAAGNMRARALRLIQLHDIALLARRFDPADWEELLAIRPDGRGLWWAFPPLLLAAHYYPGAVPSALFARLRPECPWLLRRLAPHQRLTDVSWSKIRIQAFPGVEWSRTLFEALAFMNSRIRPSREALAELREAAAQIPDVSTVPWYGVSHRNRILRWLFSRPPRVQTMLSVRAALAQER